MELVAGGGPWDRNLGKFAPEAAGKRSVGAPPA